MIHRYEPGPTPPTQVAHPGKTTARTVVQVLVGLAAIAPFLVDDLGIAATGSLVVGALGVAAAITRIMAIPAVNDLLANFGLGAEPGDKL